MGRGLCYVLALFVCIFASSFAFAQHDQEQKPQPPQDQIPIPPEESARDNMILGGGEIGVAGSVLVCNSTDDLQRIAWSINTPSYAGVKQDVMKREVCWTTRYFSVLSLQEMVLVRGVAFCVVKVMTLPFSIEYGNGEVPAYFLNPIESRRLYRDCLL